jgi:hypothetical protein
MHSSLRTIDNMMKISDNMMGYGFTSYKNIFNMKHHLPKDKSHTLEEISKLTGYKKKGLQTIFNKGVGAYYTNPLSVRKQVKSPEQWAMGRVYASINPDSKAYRVDRSHLIKGGMIGGMAKVDKTDLSKTEIRKGNYYGYQPSNIDEEMEGNMFIRDAIENDTDDAYELRESLGLTDEEIIKKLNEEREAMYKRYDTLGIEPLDQRIEEEPESEGEEEKSKSESEEEEQEGEEKSESESEEEGEEIPIIPLVENSGYHFYNNLKKEYKINMANGLGWEKITVEVTSVQEPIKEYTNDNTPIKPQTDYYFNKMAPTETIYKYWEKNKIAGRFPWDYIPCDLSNESTNIESKNYIKTQLHDPGRYIDNKKYLEIQEALKMGTTVEEIESSVVNIPTIHVTKSKLTSINKAGYSNVFRQKFKEENGKIYMDKVLYNGLYPNKEKTSLTKVYEKPIWEGKKGFIYDLLYDNARVIYDPLKDTNLKLIKDNRKNPKDSLPLYGSFDTSKYKTIIENNEEFILVPITRCKIIPLK